MPISWAPTGRPESVNPAGTLTLGQPSTFHGQVYGQAAVMRFVVAVTPMPSISSTRGGGVAVVGARTRSWLRKKFPMRLCSNGSV